MRSAARSCWSTSGPTRASTACARSRTSRLGRSATARKASSIVGVHTPEFAFEHDLGNVRRAVQRLGVRYPVALDNDYGTWNAYGEPVLARRVPHRPDAAMSAHVHFGEGDYDKTEHLIRRLLGPAARGRLRPTARRRPDAERDAHAGVVPRLLPARPLRRLAGAGGPARGLHASPHARRGRRSPTAARGRSRASGSSPATSARLQLRFHAQKVLPRARRHGDGRRDASTGSRADACASTATGCTRSSRRSATRDGRARAALHARLSAYAFTFG